ncbi:MAG: Ig-like domain-containing protein, partial [Fidelibacterota bacterium]
SSTVASDGNGQTSVTLTSAASISDLLSVLRAHIENFPDIRDSLEIAFRGVSIQLSAADTILVANGEASTTLTALVTETEHNASVAGAEVRFQTDLGIITGSSTTNTNGQADGTLTTGIFSGPAQVIAEVGNTLQDTITVHFMSHEPKQIVLNTDATSLLADGSSSATLTGTVVDSLNAPVAGVSVALTLTAGTLESSAVTTDADGTFSTTLVTEPAQTDLAVRLTAQVLSAPSVSDTVNLSYRGYHMNLSANPDGISADGVSSTVISIELLETTSGNPVANKAYTLSTNLGSIPSGGTTNENGQAGVVLTSGTQAGTARVLVVAGITDSLEVQFLSTAPRSITLTAEDAIVLGDGVAATVLTATVTDTLENPVAGVTVNFPPVGSYSPSASGITDALGQVQRNWSLSTVVDSNAHTVASLPDYSLTSDTVTTLFRGVVLTLSTSPASAYADGSSTVDIALTARTESTGNPIAGHAFSLSTNLGTITSGGTTNDAGIGTGTLSNPAAVTGTAVITATFGNLSTSASVNFVALVPDSLDAQADISALLADGESGSAITATVYDPSGNPAIGIPLVFSTDQGTVWPTETSTDSLGQAVTTIISTPSGTDLAAHVVVQSALTPTVSDTVNLTFLGVVVDLTAANNFLVADGISSTILNAQVTETTSGNPVQNSAVNWSTNLGIVPAATVTSALGLASTTFLAGTTPGAAVVTAQVGTGLTDTVHINLAAPHDSTLVVSWFNPSGNGNNGTEQLTVTAIYADGNGYPVDSVLVNFSLDPATMGVIQSPVMTSVNGVATTTLIYSIQYAGETLRIWARNSNISGYVDVTLPEAN